VTTIGLLAYGSLCWEPDAALEAALRLDSAITGVRTPFPVEFARTSSTRGGCPTLIPVTQGGAHVEAVLLPFRDGVSVAEAKTLIWRREARRSDGDYREPATVGPNTVVVKELAERFPGFDVVLAVCIARNIDRLDGETLANLAIESARKEAGRRCQDGISYLIMAKRHLIETQLSREYELVILRRLKVRSLEEAWQAARAAAISYRGGQQ